MHHLPPVVPRRSALYLPASNPRAIQKARELPVDVVILDLEDSVDAESKALARQLSCDAIKAGGFGGKELVIRINGEQSPWFADDLAAVLDAVPGGVLLPKVESPHVVRDVAREMAVRGTADTCHIWCMLETPRGVLAANEILQSHARLAVAVLGTSDLARDLHAMHTASRVPLITALGLCLLAARANNVAILDGVFLDLKDSSGFALACEQGRQLGFDGKTLIHPSQVEPCNAAFTPTEQELASARETIAAYHRAKALGKGVAVAGGRLVEELHAAEAHRLIALHEAVTPSPEV